MSELTERARTAAHDERLMDGPLYLDLADHIEALEKVLRHFLMPHVCSHRIPAESCSRCGAESEARALLVEKR